MAPTAWTTPLSSSSSVLSSRKRRRRKKQEERKHELADEALDDKLDAEMEALMAIRPERFSSRQNARLCAVMRERAELIERRPAGEESDDSERLSVAMALAEKLDHSANRTVLPKEEVEQHYALRGQKPARAGPGTQYLSVGGVSQLTSRLSECLRYPRRRVLLGQFSVNRSWRNSWCTCRALRGRDFGMGRGGRGRGG